MKWIRIMIPSKWYINSRITSLLIQWFVVVTTKAVCTIPGGNTVILMVQRTWVTLTPKSPFFRMYCAIYGVFVYIIFLTLTTLHLSTLSWIIHLLNHSHRSFRSFCNSTPSLSDLINNPIFASSENSLMSSYTTFKIVDVYDRVMNPRQVPEASHTQRDPSWYIAVSLACISGLWALVWFVLQIKLPSH